MTEGLQDTWPPHSHRGAGADVRPVEELALSHVMTHVLDQVMCEVLNPDQQTVLVETFWHHKSSREIALLIDKTPNNIDQIRRRALQKLRRALNPTQ